jgi:cytochrome c biogenesis protein CcmG, thiol:disulfide interchange protein DsbE
MRFLRLLPLFALLLAPLGLAHAGAAADFTLRDVNGTSVTLSQYKGKVVLLNFWATWCGPCQVEMPHLQAMYTELASQGFVVLGISTDDAKFDAQVKPLAKSKGLTYSILRDPTTTVVTQYNPAKTLPYNVVIDRKGQIAKVHAGYTPGDEVTLKAEIKELLAQTP